MPKIHDNNFIVSQINDYGFETKRLYEGEDQEEALRIYYHEISNYGGTRNYRVLECIPNGLRVFRHHMAQDMYAYYDERGKKAHPNQTALDDFFDAIPKMKGGGL
jgi:hypothetical protein